jgi:ABC-type transporter Mla MlaB component
VGIFSLFGKKDRQPDSTPADKDSSRKKRDAKSTSRTDKNRESASEAERSQNVQRKAAQATAMKIDAIESEMSSEFVKPLPSGGNTISGSAARPTPRPRPETLPQTLPPTKKKPSSNPSTLQLLPLIGTSTAFLLGSETLGGNVAISNSEHTPVIEEAAILFANGQTQMVEHVLQAAIEEDTLGSSAPIVWGMLFDLYQITGQQQQFENLSISYANKFETSPPAWIEIQQTETQATPVAATGLTPAVPFSGRLDGNIIKLLERAQNLAEKSRVLRLEFVRVTEVDPIGCGLLLSVLKKLQKSGHDLILVGAPELAAKIRAILEVGRRTETEAPWLLLLEILQLLNLEKDFEEASIDYCVTFEVSPPAFVAPKNKVTTALEENPPASQHAAETDHFMMPAVIEGRTEQLILAIAAYAANHKPAIIDCSRLARVDFSAAGQLLTGLTPFASDGASIELHNVNHLVAALFNVMGLKDILRILPRKS